MPNNAITEITFNCAVEGCNKPATSELWEDFDGQTLFLSACSDPDHIDLAQSFLKGKAEMGRACLEFESKLCRHDDIDLDKGKAWDQDFSEMLHKYMKQLD